MVFSLKNHHFKKSIPPEGTFAPITRNSVIVMENKRSHDIASTKNLTKNRQRCGNQAKAVRECTIFPSHHIQTGPFDQHFYEYKC